MLTTLFFLVSRPRTTTPCFRCLSPIMAPGAISYLHCKPSPHHHHHHTMRTASSLNTIGNDSNFTRIRCHCVDRFRHDAILRRANNDAKMRATTVPPYPPPPPPPRLLQEEEEEEASTKVGNGYARPLTFPDPEKLVVAVDVDEVLGSFLSSLNKFIADRYSLNHSLSEYYVYEFFKIWNCSRAEADIRVHEFFKTAYFKTGIRPIPGAWHTLHKLSKFCKLAVVTSRQNVIKEHTLEWIEEHYPGLFREIHFGNHFALDGQSRPKSDICRSLGAKVLIDDNPRYATECAEVGIIYLLYGWFGIFTPTGDQGS